MSFNGHIFIISFAVVLLILGIIVDDIARNRDDAMMERIEVLEHGR